MARGRRSKAGKKHPSGTEKALQKILGEGQAAATASTSQFRSRARGTVAGAPAAAPPPEPPAAPPSEPSAAIETHQTPENGGPSDVPEYTIWLAEGPIINVRKALFESKQREDGVLGDKVPERASITTTSGFTQSVLIKRLKLTQNKKTAKGLVATVVRAMNRIGNADTRKNIIKLMGFASKMPLIATAHGNPHQGAGSLYKHGIGVGPYLNVPIYIERSSNPANDDYLFRPNGIPFGTIPNDYPAFKALNWSIPAQTLDLFNKGSITEDWTSSWPFLVHTIFNESYLAGNQIILWVNDGRLCWATIDGPDPFNISLQTTKNAWPRFHSFHMQDGHGLCKECLKEMDEHEIADFTPTLGFPSVSKPHSYRATMKRKKKAKSKRGGTQGNEQAIDQQKDTDKKGKEKVSQAAEEPCPIRSVAGKSRERKVVDSSPETKKSRSRAVPASAKNRPAYIDIDIVTPLDSNSGPTISVATSSGTSFPPVAVPPPQTARPMDQRSSPTPKITTNRDIYEHLRSQRVELSIGIGRFVIDAIKAGKRCFIDVSLDGRIELGHWGDIFPMEHGRKHYGHNFINDMMAKPDNGPTIEVCTAPVVRIVDRQFRDTNGYKRDIEFPPSIAYQPMFKDVEMVEHHVSEPKGKGKKAATEPVFQHVSFGSLNYRIKQGVRDDYHDVEILAQDIVAALDVCDEAQTTLLDLNKHYKPTHQAAPQAPHIPHPSGFTYTAQTAGPSARATAKKERDGVLVPAAGIPQPNVLDGSFLHQKEELLQLLKEIPPGYKPENMGFDKHFKVMNSTLKELQKNMEHVQEIVRDTLRNTPAHLLQPAGGKGTGNKGKGK
ncbi:hypothetical protein TWF696_005606 [Orbilia brochopaga]|uniref:Uncharacterized protein n=1 Tax=Orbilia brochopaga TaxID=3140254 RepID=A0AAV9V2J0_9PEZI